ncbi:hypothetical protein LCGC14_2487510 [marine sediment metagenome]|uniref:HTH luxR-type domain-containing protein n=1 Tax=marine sediment metagenome TaxID=412755 RepID=A0A0F9B5S6_9ZZZZ
MDVIPTKIKRLPSRDEQIAFWLFEGVLIKEMAEKIAWTPRRVARYINSRWKIAARFNEIKTYHAVGGNLTGH